MAGVVNGFSRLDRRRRECGRDSENFIKLIFLFLFYFFVQQVLRFKLFVFRARKLFHFCTRGSVP